MNSHFEILAILTCAVFVVWLFRRIKLPAILAYLVAGIIIGQHGLNIANDQVDYEHFAELGIVFLLFTFYSRIRVFITKINGYATLSCLRR